MEWLDLVSTYEPANPANLSLYDQFMLWTNQYRALIIFVELILVYYMGFATRFRMPILKMVLLYAVLFMGAVVFSVLDTTLPVKAALFTAIVILIIVRVRVKPNSDSR